MEGGRQKEARSWGEQQHLGVEGKGSMRRSQPRSKEQEETHRRRKRRQQQQIEQLEAVVARQASEMAHLVSHLRRVKPKRPRMSATRSIWIAGTAGFKCQGDRSLCPCWLLREGTFGPEGWQIDHERMWSKGYDNRDSNCRALCATCHYRVTKEAILRDEGDESGDEEGRD